MSDDDLITSDRKELSPLQIFFVKALVVTAAIVVYFAGYFLQAAIASKAEELTFLKGGPVFWEQMERKLYRFADQPDMPAEKKQKIVDALRKISAKYKPFVDALDGQDAPGKDKTQ
jgi:Tfp pilus assembly protein PilN